MVQFIFAYLVFHVSAFRRSSMEITAYQDGLGAMGVEKPLRWIRMVLPGSSRFSGLVHYRIHSGFPGSRKDWRDPPSLPLLTAGGHPSPWRVDSPCLCPRSPENMNTFESFSFQNSFFLFWKKLYQCIFRGKSYATGLHVFGGVIHNGVMYLNTSPF